MARRKVQILYTYENHLTRTDPWHEMRDNLLREVCGLLEKEFDFEPTGAVHSAFTLMGWLDSDNFEAVRALSCIHSLSDDYPYLMQEGESQTPMPHPIDLLDAIKHPDRPGKRQLDRDGEKVVPKK